MDDNWPPAIAGVEGAPARTTPLAVDFSRRAWLFIQFVLPLLVALAVYAPYLDDYFALDDVFWLRAVDHSWLDVFVDAFQTPEVTPYDVGTPFFRPLTDVVFKLEVAIFGLRPTGFHAVNLLLHAGTAGLGGMLVARVTGNRPLGVTVAVLFASASTYGIAVSWISQLAELMGAFLAMASLVAYHEYLTTSERGRARWFLASSFILLAAAMLSKESQASAIVLLPALIIITPQRIPSIRELAVGLALIALVFAGYLAFAYDQDLSNAGFGYGIGSHVPDRFFRYLCWAVVPFGQPSKGAMRTLLAAFYLALGAFAIASGRRAPAFFFVWSLLAILPFSLFQASIQTRYAYLPTLPGIAFVLSLIAEASPKIPQGYRVPATIAGATLIAALVLISGREVREQQQFLVRQSVAYEGLYAAMRAECSGIAPGGTIYAPRRGVFDPFGAVVSPGANIFFDRVDVQLTAPPEGVEPGPNVCIVPPP